MEKKFKFKNLLIHIKKKKSNVNFNTIESNFPHNSNINNLKTKKYFSTISSTSDIMKKALKNYRAKSISSNYQKQCELLYITDSTTSTSNITRYNKINKKLKLKTSFNKLKPKLLHIASKKILNINDELDEFKISKNDDIKIHKKIISEIKPKINYDDILYEDDSLDFDLYNNDKENNHSLLEKNININVNDINFNECLKIENLYDELIKDLDNNKMKKFDKKLIIIKKLLLIFNDKFNQNLFLSFDINSLNNTHNQIFNKINKDYAFLLIKEYLIQQLIFFYIIIIISLIKNKERNIYLSGIQNLCFYYHQNFHILNLILTSNVNKFNINSFGKVALSQYNKCISMVEENKTWLNKNNFMKCLEINNKLGKQVIKNLFEQIRIYFNNNTDKNQKDFVESIINLLLEYVNSYKNVKFTNLLKELKASPSINYLYEKTNIKLLTKPNINKLITSIYKNHNNLNNLFISQKNNSDSDKIDPPFLGKKDPKYKYTLILDLDETIIHYIYINNSEYIQIRPGAELFIKELSQYYEIIIFTASYQKYADMVIDCIDPEKKIKGRLYRQHIVKIGNTCIKDLTKLGRDLKKVIIVDNCRDNFSMQPKNGINIIDFEGNDKDDILFSLKKDLFNLYKKNVDDVRPYLKQIQINMNKRANELININKRGKNFNINKTQDEHKSKIKVNFKKYNINAKVIEDCNENESDSNII